MPGLPHVYYITLTFFTPSSHFTQICLLQDHQCTCSYFECPLVMNGGMSLCWCWLKAPVHHLRQLSYRKLLVCCTYNTVLFNTVITDYNEKMIWFICLQTTVYDTAFRRESWAGRRKVAVLCAWQMPRGEANPLWWGHGPSQGMISMVQQEEPPHHMEFWCISSSGSSWYSSLLSKCSAMRPSQPYRSLSKHSLPVRAPVILSAFSRAQTGPSTKNSTVI